MQCRVGVDARKSWTTTSTQVPNRSDPQISGQKTQLGRVQTRTQIFPLQDRRLHNQQKLEESWPTIDEENDATDTDELTVETFYAELVNDTSDPDREELSESPYPVHLMPENTILFMAKAEGIKGHRVNMLPRQVQHGSVFLDPQELYLADLDNEPESETTDYDETGTYVELCFTTDMVPIILDEAKHNQLRASDVATMSLQL